MKNLTSAEFQMLDHFGKSLLSLSTAALIMACSDTPEGASEDVADIEMSSTVSAAPEQLLRAFDPRSGELRGADRWGADSAFVTLAETRREIGLEMARYTVELPNGRHFAVKVTDRLERYAEERAVEVVDLDTGSTVSWVASDDSLVQITPSGQSFAVEADAAQQTFTMEAPDGSQLTIDYAGVAPGGEQQEENDTLLALAMLNAAPIDEAQMTAMGAGIAAAASDFGPGSGQGGFEVFSRVGFGWRRYLCSDIAGVICGAATGAGGIIGSAATAGLVTFIGAACNGARAVFCPRPR